MRFGNRAIDCHASELEIRYKPMAEYDAMVIPVERARPKEQAQSNHPNQ
ncbi:hypothetical protein SAMN04488135_101313 [Pollutimonas bauzanensis]|uniref:Uncharacterized protein n=1 Tax=Pollutimonas bauzanensis TaxID=658167 RepID=A0A1M5MT73_9BURK|nr:hypothetical protein SAMN04488135_101313 [Pollutimonas bauzanensis]